MASSIRLARLLSWLVAGLWRLWGAHRNPPPSLVGVTGWGGLARGLRGRG